MSSRRRTLALLVIPTLILGVLAADRSLISARADGGDGATGAKPASPPWPFGTSPEAGFGTKRLDLYNLGPLGMKVRDADRPAPATEQVTGTQKFEMSGDNTAADFGPARLRVEILFEGGPAATAGIKVGDVLTGVSGKSFKDASLDAIAKAITKAESGAAKGVVSFNVERVGVATSTKIDVLLAVLGKEWATPTVGKAREAFIAASCKWLASKQDPSGGFPETLSSSNGAVVQSAMAGLCWLAEGSDLTKGTYSDNLKRALAFIDANMDGLKTSGPSGGANWDQSNWGWTHAAIFLGELVARSPDEGAKALLLRAGEELATRQEKTGGWAHGPGGPNALNYVELNIVSGLALEGLGMASRQGYEVPKDVMSRAQAYLEESSGGDGGVGYSTGAGQRGLGNIGRTAAAWLGCVTLGMRKDPWALRMEKYVRQHAGEVFGGHASLMQHYLFSGVAAHAIGGDALKNYWASCERDFVLARAPDGSFQPRPWHESITMNSNSDVSFGDVWTTAAWTLIVASEPVKDGRPGLPVWTGRAPMPPKPKK